MTKVGLWGARFIADLLAPVAPSGRGKPRDAAGLHVGPAVGCPQTTAVDCTNISPGAAQSSYVSTYLGHQEQNVTPRPLSFSLCSLSAGHGPAILMVSYALLLILPREDWNSLTAAWSDPTPVLLALTRD